METTTTVGAESESPARARHVLLGPLAYSMFFDLTSRGLAERTSEGSGLICVAIVGGAIVPALCYGGITAFGWFAHRHESVGAIAKQ